MHEADVGDLLDAFASGGATPVDAVEDCLRRLAEVDPVVNASVLVMTESAAAQAHESAARWCAGTARRLEGVPVGVKDTIDVAGVATRAGSRALHRTAAADASAVRRLREAGAIPLTKLQTTAFAFGDPHGGAFGVTRNPADPSRTTGASSSGPAAAVAARAVPVAIATDSAGSVRIPASHCGVVGFKPTFGAVSTAGVLPGTWSLDHVGVLGRSVAGLRPVLAAMLGPDPADPHARGHVRARSTCTDAEAAETTAGLRVGVLRGPFTARCTDATLRAFEAAVEVLSSLVAGVEEVELPHADLLQGLGFPLAAVEMAVSLDAAAPGAVEPGSTLSAFLDQGRAVSAADYLLCRRMRGPLARAARGAARHVDLLITPTMQCVAPPLETLMATVRGGEVPWFDVAPLNTLVFNVLGHPALSVPMGRGDDGLPVGLQIVGPPGRDDAVLSAGQAFEAVTDHAIGPVL